MGFLGNAIKGGLAMKAADVVRGQLQKRSGQASTGRAGKRKVTGRPVKARRR